MGMVVRTNIMAMNANRSLGVNNSSVGKSLEKLSSGFRINRAADDASGLAISEKMKSQIKGLEQASSNSQDGISLIQTAEGATQEIHNMLNRMTELATKSANGTIQDDVDRDAIQGEIDDLNKEISRIADSTNFNGINLLDGNLSGPAAVSGTDGTDAVATAGVVTGFKITTAMDAGSSLEIAGITVAFADLTGTTAADQTQEIADKINADAASTSTAKVETDGTITLTNKTPGAATTEETPTLTGGTAVATTANVSKAAGADGTATAATTTLDFSDKKASDVLGNTMKIDGTTYQFVTDAADLKDGNTAITLTGAEDAAGIAAATKTALGATAAVSGNSVVITSAATGAANKALDVEMTGGLKLQVGDTNDSFNHVTVAVDDLTAEGLGINGLDVSNQTAAGDAIKTIKTAINSVSTNRANLGSLQNRLEYTINNLDTTAENMTAANSRIRDTDMAKEMMNYTKNNILTQAAQSMLAQANQQPQAILQLLG